MESMSTNIEQDFEYLNTTNQWSKLFHEIRNLSNSKENSSLASHTPHNRALNRYYDVVPYDYSRVVLRPFGSTSTSDSKLFFDYINANFVRVKNANRNYILTQGPLASTVEHFWQMVWQQNSRAIIMLNKVMEKKQVKCYWYWPSDQGVDHLMTLSNGLTIELTSTIDRKCFLIRNFNLTNAKTKQTRQIKHFHYTTWPDFGVPSSPTVFLQYLQEVRHSGALDYPARPAIVHCSAGIGRSGTFCLVDSCLVLIKKNGIDNVNVCQVLLNMRKFRMGLIQTPEQLQFSFMAIIEGVRTLLNMDLKKTYSFSNHAAEDDGSDSEDIPPPIPPRRLSGSLETSPTASSLSYDVFVKPLPSVPDQSDDDNDNDNDNDDSNSCGNVVADADDEHQIEGSGEDSLNLSSNDENGSKSESESESKMNGDEIAEKPNSPSNGSEIRRRTNRQERHDSLEKRIGEIKKRQRSVEQWAKSKRFLYKSLAAGILLLVPVVLYLVYSWKS